MRLACTRDLHQQSRLSIIVEGGNTCQQCRTMGIPGRIARAQYRRVYLRFRRFPRSSANVFECCRRRKSFARPRFVSRVTIQTVLEIAFVFFSSCSSSFSLFFYFALALARARDVPHFSSLCARAARTAPPSLCFLYRVIKFVQTRRVDEIRKIKFPQRGNLICLCGR